MHRFVKVTSCVVLMGMCCACAENNTSSSDHPETLTSSQAPTDTGEVKIVTSSDTVESETRSADSHTHGDATLGVVLEGSTITVELETPLYNVLGFEHEAETAAQKAAVAKAESVLSDGASLFVFNSEAKCASSGPSTSVELGLEDHEDEDHEDEDHEDEDHEDEDHEDEDHEDEHHDDHDDHEEEHEGKEHDETHKDVTVQYTYKCQSLKVLKNVTVALFEQFENLSEIDLVYLGPNTQKQVELSAANPRVDLTR